MPQYGTWVSYGGDARVWLAVMLALIAVVITSVGMRLPLPARLAPVSRAVVVVWLAAIIIWLVCVTVYVRRYLDAYHPAQAAPTDRIAPVMFTVADVFVLLMVRSSLHGWPRFASAAIGALAAPLIFELPFDVIVMARTYPPIPPHPALYRGLFFVPLFAIELITLMLLAKSPAVRLRRTTFGGARRDVRDLRRLGVVRLWLSRLGPPDRPERRLGPGGLRCRPHVVLPSGDNVGGA